MSHCRHFREYKKVNELHAEMCLTVFYIYSVCLYGCVKKRESMEYRRLVEEDTTLPTIRSHYPQFYKLHRNNILYPKFFRQEVFMF